MQSLLVLMPEHKEMVIFIKKNDHLWFRGELLGLALYHHYSGYTISYLEKEIIVSLHRSITTNHVSF